MATPWWYPPLYEAGAVMDLAEADLARRSWLSPTVHPAISTCAWCALRGMASWPARRANKSWIATKLKMVAALTKSIAKIVIVLVEEEEG